MRLRLLRHLCHGASPRLARLVLAANGHPDACLVAAMLGEGRLPTPDGQTTTSDLLSLLPGARALPHLSRAAAAIARATTDAVSPAISRFCEPLTPIRFAAPFEEANR